MEPLTAYTHGMGAPPSGATDTLKKSGPRPRSTGWLTVAVHGSGNHPLTLATHRSSDAAGP